MTHPFEAVKLTDNVYWVGAVDWTIREFHGYSTPRGTTYNAYLVVGRDKVALIDTVKAPFTQELLSRVASVTPLDKVDYVISNHAEMDHSGALPEVLCKLKPERVFASKMGVRALEEHFTLDADVHVLGNDDTLDLGGVTLAFRETRMLHWPDSMFTMIPEQKLLFSQDAFGMHLASSERFADDLPQDVLYREAAKYFANILMPFSPQVTRLLAQVAEAKLSFDIIAPDHGPVFRKDPGWIVGEYAKWSALKPQNKAIIAYDTMWQSTAKMALAVGEGLLRGGVASVNVLPLSSTHRSDVATHLLDAGAIIVGSPTLNNNLYPSVADILAYIEGLRPRHLIGGAFGSYGWSGEAAKKIEQALERMKIELGAPHLRVKYVPKEEALVQCRHFGAQIAEALLPRCER